MCSAAKIVGSAQRRRRGAILQHGSFLLARSPAAPELAGLCDLSGIKIGPEALAAILSPALAKLLGLSIKGAASESASLPASLQLSISRIAARKYGWPGWTKRR
jgi:lipoate-protein ligase A